MKRRILSLALALVMVLALAAPATALEYGQEYVGYSSGGTQQYRDVPTTHWAYPSIETCSQRTWFNGYPDGTFHPDGYIRRDEAAKVFAVALGLTLEENPEITYTDTADNWAKAHIEATKALFPNVANLQGTSSFRPTQTITREETVYALLVAWRYASKTTNADLSVLNMFSDANSISAGVKPYMAVAVSEGLVSGLPDGTIAAQKGLTRAEFAALLARALSHGYGSDTTDTPAVSVNKYDPETTEARLTLTGKVSPVSTGTKLTLDGERVTLSSSGAFRTTVDLELGENTFTLVAENAYGVRDSKVVRVTRLEPEPEPAPVPSVEPSPEPSSEPSPEPSRNPEPTQQPQPSQNPTPAQQPEPSPEPSQKPEPAPEPEPSPEPSQKPDPDPQPSEPEREIIRSGKCGSDAKWILYADGEMVITGTGSMDYFGNSSWNTACKRPWDYFSNQITSVTVENGITNVGWYSFYKIKSLTKVTIADSVTEIGVRAFEGTNLTSVVVPKRVKELSYGAFRSCNNLTEITLPHSLTDISSDVFDGCSKLTNVYYDGTALDWGDIDILGNNSPLDEATIHYNSTGK